MMMPEHNTESGEAASDGCDARREVLIAEATMDPSIGFGCSFTGGKWFS